VVERALAKRAFAAKPGRREVPEHMGGSEIRRDHLQPVEAWGFRAIGPQGLYAHPAYSEAVMEAFVRLYGKGLITRGTYMVMVSA